MSSTVAVVGAGILGLTVARELSRREPSATISIFEKEPALAAHQSGRNSGVVHSGVYYTPGSLKARLCRSGGELVREFCAGRSIPFRECGKVIVAVDDEELPRLHALHERGLENEVPDLTLIGGDELRRIEPNAAGIAALHLPHTAICDYSAVVRSLRDEIESWGHRVHTDAPVTRLESKRDAVALTLRGRHGSLAFDRVVACAGLQSDRVIDSGGVATRRVLIRIVPFRGDYYVLRPQRSGLVRGLIYPVPDPRYPFLGIHLTPRTDGSVLVGPNALLALAREGYKRSSVDVRDIWATLSWPGFWRMASHHWRTGVDELGYSLSRRRFIGRARRYIPALNPADVIKGPSGMRAQAVDRQGALVDDFRIETQGRITTVINAPSPGATSSFAIAREICDRL
jgi:(S)-2-hydroxyglutarate dehydrogenase